MGKLLILLAITLVIVAYECNAALLSYHIIQGEQAHGNQVLKETPKETTKDLLTFALKEVMSAQRIITPKARCPSNHPPMWKNLSFPTWCTWNNQVKEDQAQEEQTQRDQAQRDQALKDLLKYVEANLARKMTMNDQENRTQKPRCSSNYKLLLKLPWKNSCSYKGRDQIERDQALGDQTNGAPVQEDLVLKELLTNFLKVAMKKVMTNQKTMTPKPRYSSNWGIFGRVMRFGSV